MSTGQPHPLPQQCVLDISNSSEMQSCALTLAGQYLCAMKKPAYQGGSNEMWVWNWRTGELHMVCAYLSIYPCIEK